MKNSSFKKTTYNIFKFIYSLIARFAHWIDVAIYFYIGNYIYTTSDNKFSILGFIPFAFFVYNSAKWEIRVLKSNKIIRFNQRNGRVQGFSGGQGRGKTSFMLHSVSVLKCKSVYSNFNAKVKGKFVKVLDSNVLMLKTRIPDFSITLFDEATMFYHNLLSGKNYKDIATQLYSQEIQEQLVRHFWDGNIFYSSVDITRLPATLREKITLVNFMLGQGNVTLSFITGLIINLISKIKGSKIRAGIRYWKVQQFEKIPEDNYIFDLSNQKEDTKTHQFANLIRFCGFNTSMRFEYNDRFMNGLYKLLPENQDKYYDSLEYNEDILRSIGYGKLIDFFNARISSKDDDEIYKLIEEIGSEKLESK